MDKAAFNFNKWNTIIGWFTFGIALLTYTLTVEPTMSFGIGGNTCHCSKIRSRSLRSALIPDDWRFFCHVCFRQYKIALMVNMMSVFPVPLPFYFYFGLHQSS
jgi:hypothetical protein